MKHARTLHILDAAQHAHQFKHIMTVYGAEVTRTHALKEVMVAEKHRF
jgi:hypothetical protein